ncbi:Cation/acetate symporter ActP [Streptomyces sp. YIM 130001]|uniref:sodium/solute symporter n=1 Tax=Streptomyces sp. YIM 130001 TaxID=2259644 RepID=UPI000EC1B8EA|nr:cation acetate symporter [Streptomyces sp. YIM 130001]RII20339.1 Cation/acetate symporter ActP [Streptomyces sp. YIM 130001]
MPSTVVDATPLAVAAGFEGRSLALVVFLGFVAVSLLLCGLAAADQDDPEHFYAGGAALGPAGGGLAIAGDYVSAATLLSTTGAVALAGFDGVLFAVATVVSLVLVMAVLAGPLRRPGVYTLGDFLTERFADARARHALGVAALVVLFPLLVVQLATAGRIMTAMFDLPTSAFAGCTVAGGALMVCYSAFGGMRGTGYVQILKIFVVVGVVVLVAGLVLDRFGWSVTSLLDAARNGSGQRAAYGTPGLQFGHEVAGRLDLISFQLTLILGAACMPHITMRLYPLRGTGSARRATVWAVTPVAVVCAAVVVIGLGAAALVGAQAIAGADPGGSTALLLVTAALDPTAAGPRESVLFAVVACAVFITALSTVAGITLAAASAVVRDLGGRPRRALESGAIPRTATTPRTDTGRHRTDARPDSPPSAGRSMAGEVRLARWVVTGIGAAAVLVAVGTGGRSPQVFLSYSFAAAASVLPPVLLFALFRRGFPAGAVRWTVYGTLPLITLLMAFSPAASGTPIALFPDRDFHWFPLQTPGLVTIPAGFLFAWLGAVRAGGHHTGRHAQQAPPRYPPQSPDPRQFAR